MESEWQFDAPDLAAVEHWLRDRPQPDDIVIGPPAVKRLRDLYLDTRDWRIFRAGYALRIRQERRTIVATLKAVAQHTAGPVVRREVTQRVTAATRAGLFAVPGPVQERLRCLCAARELRVLAEIRTTRKRLPLRDRGEPAGEVTLDRSVLGVAGGTGDPLLRVEVEVADGRTQALRPLVEHLRAMGGVVPARHSKYEWAMAARGLDPARPLEFGPSRVLPNMRVGDVAYAALRRQWAAVLWHEPGTRLGEDSDHLHDMRVGTRRMRAALRFLGGWLPARDVRRLRRELRVLGRALGAVRDLDVQLEQVREWRSSLITVPPAALDPFIDLLHGRREAARVRLLHFLDSPRYRRLAVFLRGWLQRAPVPRRPGVPPPIRSAGPPLLRKARKKVLRQGRAIGEMAPTGAYHRLRILGKRLRYMLEFIEPVYGEPAGVLVRALAGMQDILGLHQDAQVCMARLPALVRDEGRHLPEVTRSAVGEIAQLYAARAARLREKVPRALRKLRGRRWKALEHLMEEPLADLATEAPEEHVTR